MRTLVASLLLWLCVGAPAWARPAPGWRGVAVGGGTTGGALLGLAGGLAVGRALYDCPETDDECMGAIFISFAMPVLGASGGLVLGTTVSTALVDSHPLVVGAGVLAGTGLGLVVHRLRNPPGRPSWDPSWSDAVVGFGCIGLGAGVAAALAPPVRGVPSPVTLAPWVGERSAGLSVQARW